MIRTRIAGDEISLEPEEWRRWVEDGRIPPEALILTEDNRWVPVGELDIYYEIRRPQRPAAEREPGPAEPVFGVLFPKGGFSATEVILLVNVAAAVILLVLWGGSYRTELRQTVVGWWQLVRNENAFGLWVPTLFMHVGPGHLFRNLIALVAGAGAVEYMTGRNWTWVAYLVTGIGGAALSYYGHDRPPLSVGASGAAFGLAGAALGFLIRNYRSLPFRQQWKTRRVYVPLFVVFVGQSLLNADYLAHTGGFVTGVVLGFFLPPHARVRNLEDPYRDEVETIH